MQALWMVWYFIGSMIVGALTVKVAGVLTAPFFTVFSLFGLKHPSSSERER